MTTLYANPSLDKSGNGSGGSGMELDMPDTTVPPKAAQVIKTVSVNGVEITEADIMAEAQNHPADTPGGAVWEAARALVIRELLWQEAQRLEIAAAPEGDDAGRMETAIDAAIRTLIDTEVEVPAATQEECRRYYDKHPQKFHSEPLFEARHILLAAPETDPMARSAAKDTAKTICGLLAKTPGAFADLARAHSDCPSKEQGGNLGQLSKGSTVTEFENALAQMKAGEISAEPVATRFGFHVIALDRKIDGEHLPFEAVSDRISAWLDASVWAKAVSQYISVLAGQADVKGIDLEAADSPLIQ